ncbi:DUF4126 domain-containing protein [Kribbella sancticallisti]|uniref:DUF4126 domain-containing protein n=1 Tax=Kribbella sancticallisti TaxID=460087 RepID=A0ABP4QD14_9ACTN
MEALPLAFTTGWASGINAYACVLILGLLGRFADVDDVPTALTGNGVLIAAGVLFAFEFVADKIPYVDSAWDGISTLIRPTVGAVIAALMSGEASTLNQALIVTTGGVVALVSHLVKSSLRLAINTSPEPASNIVASSGEDIAVASVVTLAAFHPTAALIIAAVLLLLGLIAVYFAFRAIRRGRARFRAWREKRNNPAAGSSAV